MTVVLDELPRRVLSFDPRRVKAASRFCRGDGRPNSDHHDAPQLFHPKPAPLSCWVAGLPRHRRGPTRADQALIAHT